MMKRIMAVSMLLAPLPMNAQTWQTVSRTAEFTDSYDSASLRRNGAMIEVTISRRYYQVQPTGAIESRFTQQVDCEQRRVNIVAATMYNPQGRVISDENFRDDPLWDPIEPESVVDELRAAIC